MMIRKLHLGGKIRSPGWEIFDALPGDHVDHQGNANDLSRFPEGTFAELYASHILEHFDYREELVATLMEWRRVLIPGGTLYISVPDLDTLCGLMLDARLSPGDKFQVMRMMFGGHMDRWDYHQVGLNELFLSELLRVAGFTSMQRVQQFPHFQDTSRMVFAGRYISLNVIVKK